MKRLWTGIADAYRRLSEPLVKWGGYNVIWEDALERFPKMGYDGLASRLPPIYFRAFAVSRG